MTPRFHAKTQLMSIFEQLYDSSSLAGKNSIDNDAPSEWNSMRCEIVVRRGWGLLSDCRYILHKRRNLEWGFCPPVSSTWGISQAVRQYFTAADLRRHVCCYLWNNGDVIWNQTNAKLTTGTGRYKSIKFQPVISFKLWIAGTEYAAGCQDCRQD